jgi:hypothetical protein
MRQTASKKLDKNKEQIARLWTEAFVASFSVVFEYSAGMPEENLDQGIQEFRKRFKLGISRLQVRIVTTCPNFYGPSWLPKFLGPHHSHYKYFQFMLVKSSSKERNLILHSHKELSTILFCMTWSSMIWLAEEMQRFSTRYFLLLPLGV